MFGIPDMQRGSKSGFVGDIEADTASFTRLPFANRVRLDVGGLALLFFLFSRRGSGRLVFVLRSADPGSGLQESDIASGLPYLHSERVAEPGTALIFRPAPLAGKKGALSELGSLHLEQELAQIHYLAKQVGNANSLLPPSPNTPNSNLFYLRKKVSASSKRSQLLSLPAARCSCPPERDTTRQETKVEKKRDSVEATLCFGSGWGEESALWRMGVRDVTLVDAIANALLLHGPEISYLQDENGKKRLLKERAGGGAKSDEPV
ncbi:hypothetical protein BDK51DRAFT_30960 [Blyttiomyces helicus]|uniref:Uncharacterized protein n=1 Tax=Blyttiomyces helicus TaxID=388810 RepID=A0A4P9WQX4_9FUNG|nr:hypothetical protein BDK51DRAFT_30960 [Blyttiomyces helicus]|eukprot:RKO94805.1 hypothetical protein BDK51DRAFT_30960 [Blyttiomyces helicus]